MTRRRGQRAGARHDWYAIRNTATGEGPAVVYLFDEIDSWWGVSADEFVRELAAIDSDEIVVKINSPGGNAYDGIAIMNALLAHPAKITTSVEGLAASAASFIAVAGDDRIIRPGAELMVHNAWSVAVGNASEIRAVADQLDRTSANVAGIYARHAGGDVADWQAAMDAETWYTADEAVAAGLIHRVEDPAKAADDEPEEARASWDLSVYAYAGRAAAPAPRRFARSRKPVAPAAAPRKEKPVALIDDLRTRLGVADDADESTVLAALDEALDERAGDDDTTEGATEGTENAAAELTPAAVAASARKLGMTVVDADTYAATVAAAQQGAKAFERQQSDHRNAVLDTAVRTGRITTARREHYAKMLAADPEGTEELLTSLPAGMSVPINEVGHAIDVPEEAEHSAEMAGVFAQITGRSIK